MHKLKRSKLIKQPNIKKNLLEKFFNFKRIKIVL